MVNQIPLIDTSNTPFNNENIVPQVIRIAFILSNIEKQSIFKHRGTNVYIRSWICGDQYYVSSDRADYAGYYKINVNRYN